MQPLHVHVIVNMPMGHSLIVISHVSSGVSDKINTLPFKRPNKNIALIIPH